MDGGDIALRPVNMAEVEVDPTSNISQSYGRGAPPLGKAARANSPQASKAIDLSVTAGMITEARKGLKWREEHGRGEHEE